MSFSVRLREAAISFSQSQHLEKEIRLIAHHADFATWNKDARHRV